MSRIGKLPVVFGDKTKVEVDQKNTVVVKGQKSTLSIPVNPLIQVTVEGNKVVLSRPDDSQKSKAFHGLYRTLVHNAVFGVEKGFLKKMELLGVGYRASVAGRNLELQVGYSHLVNFAIPEGIEIKVEKQTGLEISGASKELVGEVAAKIRAIRPPEPYKGKGIRYAGERVRQKEGKSAGKK